MKKPPPEDPWHGYDVMRDPSFNWVHALRSDDCGTVVQYYWGGVFPVKHWARAYFSTDSIDRSECRGEWNRGRRLVEHWYELVD